MPKIKILVFTGNRAEYGLQYPIIKSLNNSQKIDCQLVVSGSHLEKKFGETFLQIKKDKAGKVVNGKDGKPVQECKKIKVHKKLEGTEIPEKKK
jgi:UDP-N-acetylglucosamine 2-epimerase (non-hydrolysing)/GDP/UDP-N,N'-diacetylbacillosamine 2-epimerase (hydrolysing)